MRNELGRDWGWAQIRCRHFLIKLWLRGHTVRLFGALEVRTSLDIDTPAEHEASDRDPGCTGRSRPFVVVVEAADDPSAADMNLGVSGHHDGDVADDRGGVDSRLAVDEPGLTEIDLAVAYHRQPPEGAPHHPSTLALEPGNDPNVPCRGGCRACPVAWLWCRNPQVVHDRCKFGVSLG